MNAPTDPMITQALKRVQQGDPKARETFPLIVEELRKLARRRMRNQPADHTLDTTALVNEAYLKLFNDPSREWKDRQHFFRMAAAAMRTILVDSARRRTRRPSRSPLVVEALVEDFERRSLGLEALDICLEKLEALDPDMVRLVELRFFCGLAVKETAELMGMPLRSAERELAAARAWLRDAIERESAGE